MSLGIARLTDILGRGRLPDSAARGIFRHRTALSSRYRSTAPEDRYPRRVAFRPVV